MGKILVENRVQKLFNRKPDDILSVYFTAGYPGREDTVPIIELLDKNGVDLIEIGMPFSDPIADGPTIQRSSNVAIKNGMNIPLLMEQLQDIRKVTQMPLVLMGYLNPVFQYGLEKFCRDAAQVGIDAFILPDLPMYEYEEEYREMFRKYGLFNIFLVTPQTSEERIKKIDELSEGFIYLVSSASITGAKDKLTSNQLEYFTRIRSMQLKHPCLIGFGISNHDTFAQATRHAAGAIIGSAFIKAVGNSKTLGQDIPAFIHSIRKK